MTRASWWSIAGLLLGGSVCVGILLATGGGPQPMPEGLPDAGPVIGWLLPSARVLADVFTVATVGFLLVAVVLLPSGPRLEGLAVQAVRLAARSAGLWFASLVVLYVANVGDLYGRTLTGIEPRQLLNFLTVSDSGRGLAVSALVVLIVAVICRWSLEPRTLALALGLALAAQVPIAFGGHAASAGSHTMATFSLMCHLIGVVLWVGGLVGLGWVALRGSRRLEEAVARYSVMALWCFVTVAVSGLINAAVRLGDLGGLDSTYGALVIVKVVALVVLGGFGVAQRRRLATAGAGFARLAITETLVMVATVGLAVALSRTATPLGDEVLRTPAETLLGGSMPPEPTWGRVLWGWTPSGFGLAVVAFGAAFYLAGLRVMRRRGDRWPVGRSLAWFSGLAVVAWATFGGLGAYSHVMFSLHMVSHMMLSMIAPILLVLGAPVTLALRTLPGPRRPGENSPRSLFNAALHSRVAQFYTHPIVAASIFMGSLYGLYFTGLFGALMTSHSGHAVMELHFLLSGFLFYFVVVGVDPSPRALPPLARFGVLMVSVPFHAFFSVALMSSSTIIAESFYRGIERPYALDLAHDQYLGGGFAWAMGEVPLLIVMAAIFIQWFVADRRESTRRDRAAERDDDAELDAYNDYLRSLADKS